MPRGKEKPSIPRLDMPKISARLETITMDMNTAFYSLDFDPAFTLGVIRAPTPVGIGEARFVAPEERITLLRPPYEEEEAGVPRARAEGILPEFAAEIEEEEGFEIGFDLGIEAPEAEGFPPEEIPPPIEPTIEGLEAFPPLEGLPPEVPEAIPAEIPGLELGPPPVTPERRPAEELAEERRLKRLRTFEDLRTELSDDELREVRRNYPLEMEQQREQLRLVQQARENARLVHEMVFGPPAALAGAPLLVEFWSTTIGASLKAVDDRYKNMKTATIAGRPLPPPPLLPEFVPPSPGVPLAFEEEVSTIISEVARGLSPRAAELPWNIYMERRREESLAAGMETISETAAREWSIETPTGLRPPRRAPSISIESEEGFFLPSPRYRTPSVSLEEARRPPPEPEELPSAEQIFMEDLETETRNFYGYAKSVRDELEDPRFFFFSDLAPVASSSPTVAAQAFYHLLVLTSTRRLRVKQDEPYGEIQIQVVE